MNTGLTQGPFYAECSVDLALGEPSANGKKYTFEDCRISRNEISGIDLKKIDYNFKIGSIVILTVRLHSSDAKLKLKASVYKVTTADRSKLGLTFLADEFQAELLNKYIAQHGDWGSVHLRTSPRILVSRTIPLMPVFTTLFTHDPESPFDHLKSNVLEIIDISPFGLQLISECKSSFSLKVSQYVHLFLEPRGSQSQKIRLYGQIVRISDGISWDSGNQFRTVAIKLVDSPYAESAIFHEFFRRIISEIET